MKEENLKPSDKDELRLRVQAIRVKPAGIYVLPLPVPRTKLPSGPGGRTIPSNAKTFPFAQTVEAYKYLESNAQVGKLVIMVPSLKALRRCISTSLFGAHSYGTTPTLAALLSVVK